MPAVSSSPHTTQTSSASPSSQTRTRWPPGSSGLTSRQTPVEARSGSASATPAWPSSPPPATLTTSPYSTSGPQQSLPPIVPSCEWSGQCCPGNIMHYSLYYNYLYLNNNALSRRHLSSPPAPSIVVTVRT